MQNFSTISPQLCQIGQKNQIIYCIHGDSTFDKAAPGADFLNLKLVIIKQIPYYRPTIFRQAMYDFSCLSFTLVTSYLI